MFFCSAISVLAADDFSVMNDTQGKTLESCECGKGTGTDVADEKCKQVCGTYALNDFMVLIKKVSDLILQISGGLSLLAFVLGGAMFLFSSGNKTLVERGKTTIIGGAIGLFIVFFSYVIIKFSYEKLTADNAKRDDPFTAGWNPK